VETRFQKSITKSRGPPLLFAFAKIEKQQKINKVKKVRKKSKKLFQIKKNCDIMQTKLANLGGC